MRPFAYIKIPAFLLLLSGLANAACTTAVFNEEGSLIGILALLSAFIISLAYMASQAFRRPEWEVWARRSGIQIGVSLILIVLVNLAILTGCGVSYTVLNEDMFKASYDYLGSLAYSNGFPLVYSLMEESFQNQLESLDFKYTANPLIGGSGFARHAGERTKANAQDMVVNMLMPLIASLY